MEKREMIIEALTNYGASTAKQLSCYINRTYGETITPAAISGTLKSLVNKGEAGSSKCGNTQTTYWMNKKEW